MHLPGKTFPIIHTEAVPNLQDPLVIFEPKPATQVDTSESECFRYRALLGCKFQKERFAMIWRRLLLFRQSKQVVRYHATGHALGVEKARSLYAENEHVGHHRDIHRFLRHVSE